LWAEAGAGAGAGAEAEAEAGAGAGAEAVAESVELSFRYEPAPASVSAARDIFDRYLDSYPWHARRRYYPWHARHAVPEVPDDLWDCLTPLGCQCHQCLDYPIQVYTDSRSPTARWAVISSRAVRDREELWEELVDDYPDGVFYDPARRVYLAWHRG